MTEQDEIREIKIDFVGIDTTTLKINITGLKPGELIARLKQTTQYFEKLQQGEIEIVPAVFTDYMQAVEMDSLDTQSHFYIGVEYDDREKYSSESAFCLGTIHADEKSYIEPSPNVIEWMKSDKPYEEFEQDYDRGLRKFLQDKLEEEQDESD